MKTSLAIVANSTFNKTEIRLRVEGDEAPFWGQVEYDNNLIVEEANSIASLQDKLQTLLLNFHELDANAYEFKIESA